MLDKLEEYDRVELLVGFVKLGYGKSLSKDVSK